MGTNNRLDNNWADSIGAALEAVENSFLSREPGVPEIASSIQLLLFVLLAFSLSPLSIVLHNRDGKIDSKPSNHVSQSLECPSIYRDRPSKPSGSIARFASSGLNYLQRGKL